MFARLAALADFARARRPTPVYLGMTVWELPVSGQKALRQLVAHSGCAVRPDFVIAIDQTRFSPMDSLLAKMRLSLILQAI
jgi:hypothetical protein